MTKQRLGYIDFAKGFAILSIVVFHYCQPYVSGIFSKAIMIGGTGVHLFFVLSGFGLGLSSKVGAFSFYKKRFVKILIPYYVIILIIYVINIIHPVYKDDGLYALCGHLFFYKMFDKNIIGSFGYLF
ncbi:MAG: acyltransferase family protein [Sedimentisphaerales bacterium]|nr:acyltransferase family protein [Sedimentisphaerales bacterium]